MRMNLKFNPKDLLNNLFGQTGSPVAVDFGTAGIKLLVIEPGPTPKLEAIAFVATPPELRTDARRRFAFQFEQLPKLVQKLGLRHRKVVCSIPASQTFCKHVQIDRAPEVPMSILAQGVIAQEIGCDPSALVYQPIEVGPLPSNPAKSEVICTAVSRELVNLMMAAARHAKLEVAGIHGEFIATVRGFDHITKRTEDATLGSMYLDIGESATKVVIAQGSRIVFVRFVETGTRALDVALAQSRSCSIEQATALRLEHAALIKDDVPAAAPQPVAVAVPTQAMGIFALMPQDRRRSGDTPEKLTEESPLPEIAEHIEILADEIQMCVSYAESAVPGLRIDRLLCMGGGASDRALCRRIARTLQVQAQVIDPLARLARNGTEPNIGIDMTRPHPEWSVAMGLCACPLAI